MQRVVGFGPEGKLRRVGAADHNHPGALEIARHRRVVGRDHVAVGRHAIGGGVACLIDIDLD
jgi:hypothetical protein